MKHLYIIGNGFDIFSGLSTRYSDFCDWLRDKHPFVYENFCSVFNIEDELEWWNDFEINLGYLNVKEYLKRYSPQEKSIDEILATIKYEDGEVGDGLPSSGSTLCASRLHGLLEIIECCIEKWINSTQRIFIDPKYIDIQIDNSYFINFNYTDTLQVLYNIPEEQILHIHGKASKQEKLIFGHANHLYLDDIYTADADKTCEELNVYYKNPYIYIYKHKDLPSILKNVEYVHIYGFSISEVDEYYLDWIEKNTPKYSKWEFSWYSDKDLQRINKFILNHKGLKDRSKLIQLEDIKIQRTF